MHTWTNGQNICMNNFWLSGRPGSSKYVALHKDGYIMDNAGTAWCSVICEYRCGSCDSGYHKSGGLCIANECTCSNGEAVTGTDCTTHNAEKCSSCSTGFYLSSDTCLENQCTCSNGNGATGTSCQTNGDAKCDTCNSGFELPCVSTPVSFTSGLSNQTEETIKTSKNLTHTNMFLTIKSCQPWCINARFSDGQYYSQFYPSYAIDGTAVVHEYSKFQNFLDN